MTAQENLLEVTKVNVESAFQLALKLHITQKQLTPSYRLLKFYGLIVKEIWLNGKYYFMKESQLLYSLYHYLCNKHASFKIYLIKNQLFDGEYIGLEKMFQ